MAADVSGKQSGETEAGAGMSGAKRAGRRVRFLNDGAAEEYLGSVFGDCRNKFSNIF